MLKRFVGDEDLKNDNPYMPELASLSGKKVAVIGAGPAGLAAAYYLQIKGHQTVVFDQNERAGGELLQIDKELLPAEIIDQEVAQIVATGVQLRLNETINEFRFIELQKEFDAVVVAFGAVKEDTYDYGLRTNNTESLLIKPVTRPRSRMFLLSEILSGTQKWRFARLGREKKRQQ